jgi:hypothetical protein
MHEGAPPPWKQTQRHEERFRPDPAAGLRLEQDRRPGHHRAAAPGFLRIKTVCHPHKSLLRLRLNKSYNQKFSLITGAIVEQIAKVVLYL